VRVVLVAALARDRTIGVDGGLPWHYPDDLKRFKQDTLGTALIMGRKTLESIGRPLPKRPNIVLTRDPQRLTERFPGILAVRDLDAGLQAAVDSGLGTASVIGGGQVYEAALPRADALLLTFVPHDGGGDTFFPAWDKALFHAVEREPIGALERVLFER
jgi:dihydrofolate reductase